MENIDEIINTISGDNALWYALIAFLAVSFISLIFKPLVKKLLNNRVAIATACAEDIANLLKVEQAKNTETMTEAEKTMVANKIETYTRQLKDYQMVLTDKWYADILSDICFIMLIVFCALGTVILFLAQGLFENFSIVSYLGSTAICVSCGEVVYALYERVGFKALFKDIAEKLKIK